MALFLCTGCTVCCGAMEGKEQRMYRMYGQICAPAISALPPSVVVVCCGAMRPTWMWEGRAMQEQLPRWQGATHVQDVLYACDRMDAEEQEQRMTMDGVRQFHATEKHYFHRRDAEEKHYLFKFT